MVRHLASASCTAKAYGCALLDLVQHEILRQLQQALLDALELRSVRIGEVHAAPTAIDAAWTSLYPLRDTFDAARAAS